MIYASDSAKYGSYISTGRLTLTPFETEALERAYHMACDVRLDSEMRVDTSDPEQVELMNNFLGVLQALGDGDGILSTRTNGA